MNYKSIHSYAAVDNVKDMILMRDNNYGVLSIYIFVAVLDVSCPWLKILCSLSQVTGQERKKYYDSTVVF